jgi:hypothetical protein
MVSRNMADGSEYPDLTLEMVEECSTKKQQRILDALLDTEPVNPRGVFDVEVVDTELEERYGEDRPTVQYIYHVKGRYTTVVPKDDGNSWDGSLTVVQVKENDGYGELKKAILDSLKHVEVRENGAISVKELSSVVMDDTDRDSPPTSYIWQTLGQFTAAVPTDQAERYSVVSLDDTDNKNTQEGGTDQSKNYEGQSSSQPVADEGADPASYHMGYADGYRAARQELGD